MNNQTWNVADIAQSEVLDTDGRRIGTLIDVLPSGSNDIWVVKSDLPGVEELLIPALATVVREVDVEHKRIVVNLPPGLTDIYSASK